MSIFYLGGRKGIIVPENEIKCCPDEDRYFIPGVIHGSKDYIIQAYYWSNDEGSKGDRIGVRYLYADTILEGAEKAKDSDGNINIDIFEEYINVSAEEFILENDGTGDFYELNNVWEDSVSLSYEDVIRWAHENI